MARRRETEEKETEQLLPADIDEILERYGHLLKSYPNLRDRESIFADFKRTNKKLEVLFPLKEHPIHGKTGLHVVENYDEAGYVRLYQYHWKRIIPKMGVQMNHISGWGNDPHDAEWTPDEYRIETEPHHHHYDPSDRRRRRENYDVRTLDQAFAFITIYLDSGEEYKP
ncbi:DUF6516 family protein [Niallia taxi]|uniref:toxin-antitoxin system TumE family protein n=1 Tax=Niallia taxi TaxID=2499688 RepID=UPI003178BA59